MVGVALSPVKCSDRQNSFTNLRSFLYTFLARPALHCNMLTAAYPSLTRASLTLVRPAWPLRQAAALFKVRPAPAGALHSRSRRHQLSVQPCHSTLQHSGTVAHDRQSRQQSPHVSDNVGVVFFFDIDNCLYPKSSGIPNLMKARYHTIHYSHGAEVFACSCD